MRRYLVFFTGMPFDVNLSCFSRVIICRSLAATSVGELVISKEHKWPLGPAQSPSSERQDSWQVDYCGACPISLGLLGQT